MSNSILSQAERESLLTARVRLTNLPPERIIDVQTAPAAPLRDLLAALQADPAVVRASVLAFVKAVNELCDGVLRKQGRVNRSAVQAAEDGFVDLADHFDLDTKDAADRLRAIRDARAVARQLDIAAIDATIVARAEARAGKDFDTADRLQRELLAQGIVLLDHATGSDWTLATPPSTP